MMRSALFEQAELLIKLENPSPLLIFFEVTPLKRQGLCFLYAIFSAHVLCVVSCVYVLINIT